MQPRLRFKGFNSNWKLSTLGQLMTGFSYGLCASATKYNGRDKYLRITDIDDNNRRFNYDNLSSPGVDLSNKSKYLLKQGDIVFARTGASVGKAYLYNKKDGRVYYAGFLIRANSNKSDKIFLFNHTFTQKYWNFIRIYSMRSGQPGINTKALKSFKIAIPTLPEQRLIGRFFAKLDKLISLQQAKFSLLKKQKRGYLQKLFPQKNESVPRLRFSGFQGEWKRKHLVQIVKVTMGQSPLSKNYTKNPNDSLLIQGNADLSDGKIVPRLYTKQITKLSHRGDTILTIRAPVGAIAVNNYGNAVIGRGVADIAHNSFILYWLEHFQIAKGWLRYTTGSTFNSINSKVIKNLLVTIPSLKEQKEIGHFLKRLDDNINLQKSRLNYLYQLKRAYLQKMFC